jgi:heme/copper-type cytochrome/quinol oxidase subunit 1
MTRVFFGEMLYFLLPFAVFALYLVILRRNPLLFSSWSNHAVWLAIAGLACVIAALLVTGFMADRSTGAFQPTHVENGHIVPGQFR